MDTMIQEPESLEEAFIENDNHFDWNDMLKHNKLEGAPLVAPFNAKGGVGKTMISNSIGIIAAYSGLRVCIVETCEQKNTTLSLASDISFVHKKMPGILELMLNPQADLKKLIIGSKIPNLYIMPAAKGMNNYFTTNFSDKSKFPNGYKTIEKAFERLRKAFDLIVIDTPPGVEALPVMISAACDLHFYIRNTDGATTDSIVSMYESIKEMQKKLQFEGECLGIIMNDTNNRPAHCREIAMRLGIPPLRHIDVFIPYSRTPGGYNAYIQKKHWIRSPFDGKKKTRIEEELYKLTYMVLSKVGIINGEKVND